MKLTLDDKICLKHHLTLPEALVALAIRMTEKDLFTVTLSNLLDREVLVLDNKTADYYVTQPWSDVLDEIICDSSGGIDDEERLLNLAKKMRECFPEGKMPGTPYYYRCNNREVVLKMKKFFLQYGNYPDDRIIDATKRFVASHRGDYRYLPLIKYFISKNKTVTDEDGKNHITEVSQLASYLENKEQVSESGGDDWLMTTRN